MQVDMYDNKWIVEVDGYIYNIINSNNGYDVIADNNDDVCYYSSNSFESCLIWCYRS